VTGTDDSVHRSNLRDIKGCTRVSRDFLLHPHTRLPNRPICFTICLDPSDEFGINHQTKIKLISGWGHVGAGPNKTSPISRQRNTMHISSATVHTRPEKSDHTGKIGRMMNLELLEQMYRFVLPISPFPPSTAASQMWTVGNISDWGHTQEPGLTAAGKGVIGMASLSLSRSLHFAAGRQYVYLMAGHSPCRI
jgi:hypothetical protein